jgi:hypothetical protein
MKRNDFKRCQKLVAALTLNKKSGQESLATLLPDRRRHAFLGRGAVGVHAACRVRLLAASDARLSSVAHPFAANVSHWSLGMLSRNIHERTVWGETEQTAATVSGVPACFTMDA